MVPDIRAFTLQKEWTSKQVSRPPEKRGRDAAQAKMLNELTVNMLGLSLNAPEMDNVPEYLLAAGNGKSQWLLEYTPG